MTIVFRILLILTVLLSVGCIVLQRKMNIDRTTADYQNRKIDIWNGNVPSKIAGIPKYDDLKFARFLFGNEHEEDVPYMLDYSLADTNAKPAILILPGGSYAFRVEKAEGTEVAEWFNSMGVSAFVLNYRVEPYKHPIPLWDVTRAIKYLRANAKTFHLNPNKIGVIGFSAGGHLAATLGTQFDLGSPSATDEIDKQSSKPDALILCYPLITMDKYAGQTDTEKRCIKKLLGENPSDSLLHALSLEKNVTNQTPPTFIWTTQTDDMVNPINAQLFSDSLKAKGVQSELHIFPKGRHGLGLAKGKKDVGTWTTRCENWLRKIAFKK
jgi:acetyl esterase/lipase